MCPEKYPEILTIFCLEKNLLCSGMWPIRWAPDHIRPTIYLSILCMLTVDRGQSTTSPIEI